MVKLKIDASSNRESTCKLRWKRLVIDGLQTPLVNNDTLYGSAVHKFVYCMFMTNGDFSYSVKAANDLFKKPCNIKPKKRHLTAVHLTKTCLDFWQKFAVNDELELLIDPAAICFHCEGEASRIEGDKSIDCKWCNGTGRRPQPLVEVNFEIIVYQDDNLTISICGTIDKLGKIKGGCYGIVDNKITSSWDKSDYLLQYDLSNQLNLYLWAIHKLALMYPESVFAAMAKTPIGTAVDGVFISSSKDTEFVRSPFKFYKPHEIEEYSKLVAKQVQDLVELYYRGADYNTRDGLISNACYGGWGFCRYFNLCNAPDDIARQHLIRRDFIHKPYDPLMFGKD